MKFIGNWMKLEKNNEETQMQKDKYGMYLLICKYYPSNKC